MAIPRFNEDLAIISKLGDNPGSDNNLTTDAFRAKFDEGPQKIQKFLNDVLIPAAEQSSSPQEGLSMQGGINMNGQKLNGIAAPEAEDDAANKKYADSLHKLFSVNLPASGWSASAPYTQTVSVSGILSSDTPHYGVAYSSNAETALAQKEAFAMVDDLDTSNGSVKFTCFEEKPEVNLTIQLEVNR